MYRPSTHIYFSQLFLNTDWHGGGVGGLGHLPELAVSQDLT